MPSTPIRGARQAPGPLVRARRRLARPVRAVVALALLGGGAALAGCREATAPLTPATFVGTWVLRTVEGRPLPYVVPRATNNFAIYGSRKTLQADGTFSGIDSAASLGDTLRAVQRYTGAWRFVPRGFRRQDVVWLRYNSLRNGLPLNEEHAYLVRDRGRALVQETDTRGAPIPAASFTRE